MKHARYYLAFFVGGLLLFFAGSCGKDLNLLGKKKGKSYSSTTGWKYNDPEWGGFIFNDQYVPTIGPGLVLIPGGTYMMGQIQQDVMYDWNNIPRRVTVASFYMDETEVRNVDYREYLHWLNRVYGESNPQVVENARPDQLVWRDELSYNEPYVNNYFIHPAYSDYPVVGVTWEQARDYATWRSDRVNEMLLIKDKIIKSNPDQKGADNFNVDAYLAGEYDAELEEGVPDLSKEGEEVRHAKREDGIFLPNYRLPTEAEWEYAAYGLKSDEEENIEEMRVYPWAGKWVRNDGESIHSNKARDRGDFMANFVRGRGDYMGIAGNWNDKGDLTLPVKSFWPNDFGLYCMAGNVNEWVSDIYRPLTFIDVEEFNPYRGNVFLVPAVDEEGNTLPKDSLGRMPKTPQSDEDVFDRYNYKRGDARNYLDGDSESRITEGNDWNNPLEIDRGSKYMYKKGFGRNREGITSLISDETRIYKGGSWKDRAYWIAPSMRRYLDQKEARDDIGFRCAMSHLGAYDTKHEEVKKSDDKKFRLFGKKRNRR